MINTLLSNPLMLIIYAIALLTAITVHEFSHAYVADHLGDPTPRLQGRLSFNPLVHLDPMGILFLLLVGFGWGKPVGFDPYNLKDPRRDAALISIAGPISNFTLALLLSILLRLFIFFNQPILITIGTIFIPYMIILNVILGVFNLLPIHPLDGFKIVGGILPEEKAREWYELQKYGLIFLLLLIIPLGQSSMLDTIMRPVATFLLNLFLPHSFTGGGII